MNKSIFAILFVSILAFSCRGLISPSDTTEKNSDSLELKSVELLTNISKNLVSINNSTDADTVENLIKENHNLIEILSLHNKTTPESELTALAKQLSLLSTQITTQIPQNIPIHIDEDSIKISHESQILNSVYFIVAPQDELIEKEIVLRSGFARNKLKINPQANLKKLNKANREYLNELAINSSKFELLSSHPSDSYFIDSAKGNLVIIDNEKFWKNSRFAVISCQ